MRNALREGIAITYMKLSLPNKIILSALSLLWGVPSVIFGVLFSKEILYSLVPDDVYYLVGAISILAALVILWLTRKRWVKIFVSSFFVILSFVSVLVFACAVSYGNLPWNNPMPLFSYCIPLLHMITSITALIYYIVQR